MLDGEARSRWTEDTTYDQTTQQILKLYSNVRGAKVKIKPKAHYNIEEYNRLLTNRSSRAPTRPFTKQYVRREQSLPSRSFCEQALRRGNVPYLPLRAGFFNADVDVPLAEGGFDPGVHVATDKYRSDAGAR